MIAIWNLSRMWYFTGETAYAQKAHDILLAWATTHTSFGGRESMLDLGDYAVCYVGGADILRRAMGKKNAHEMAQQRSVFVEAAVARGVARPRAAYIFDLMEKFAGYGFNKSHSAAYALLAYQTAFLKAHHTAAFMAAVLTADMDRTEKVVYLIQECKELGIRVQSPDLNSSVYEFAVGDDRRILTEDLAGAVSTAGSIIKVLSRSAERSADEMVELARKTLTVPAEISHSGGRGLLEIAPPGASKASALEWLCVRRGITANANIAASRRAKYERLFGAIPADRRGGVLEALAVLVEVCGES